MQKKFEAKDASALPEILGFVSSALKNSNINRNEISHAELMCEEALVNLIEHGDFTKNNFISVNVKKFLGDVSIELKVPGNEFDFYINGGIPSSDDDDIETIRSLVLRSFGNQIKYKHQWNCNTVRITALSSPYSNLYRILGTLILAAVAGFVIKNFMPEELSGMINGNFLQPVHSLLLNGLKMCAIPIMFFSMASCFSQTYGTDLSRMKRVGGKMFSYSMINNIIAVFIGVALVFMFGIGKGMTLTALSNSPLPAARNVSFSIGDTIKGLIPDNFLKPFFEGNMLQLMVLAVLTGTALSAGGLKKIAASFDEINGLFMKIMEMFLRFMPLLVFCSITSMLISTGAKTLLLVLGIFLTLLAANALILATYCLMIAFIARLNPAVMLKKSVPAVITAFTTSSSAAAMPDGMKVSGQLGISEKMYSFLIPLGTLVSKNSLCLFISVLTLSVCNMYGIELALPKIFSIIFYSILLPMTMPGIPGLGIIALSSLFALADCPVSGLFVAVLIDPVMDMFRTVLHVLSSLTSALIIAKSENQLDIEKYKS